MFSGDVVPSPLTFLLKRSLSFHTTPGNGEWALEVTVPHSEHVTEHMQNVTDLMGGSTYSIAVTVSREGEGGEGERSSPITVTTVAIGTTPRPGKVYCLLLIGISHRSSFREVQGTQYMTSKVSLKYFVSISGVVF